MEDLSAGLKVIRQHLHQYPEVSGNEYETYKYLYNLLERIHADRIGTVADTGLLVTFKGRSSGKNILFRGDTDALPIHEVNDIEYRSVTDGVAHKCGHDGHSTIMYGLCRFYGQNRPEEGDVYILFQPAEENGRGARGVVDSGVLDDKEIDLVFALHNVPSYPLNTIVCREGSFTPGVTTLIAYFEGHTAHAAEPWNGHNPAAAMSEYLLAALENNMEDKEQHHFVTITPVYTTLGDTSAYGTSAGSGSVHLTVRADNSDRLETILNKLKNDATSYAEKHQLTVSFGQKETFESNQNAPGAVALVKAAATICKLPYYEKEEPFRWGEDFGLFTNRVKGAMFGIGAGEDCKPLHHPAYDFPDEITGNAINMFITIQQQAQIL